MNEYFNYLNMDTEFMPAFPSDNVFNKNISQNKTYPSQLENITGLQNINNQVNFQNTQTNMSNSQNCGLISPAMGFSRGNMFPDLYDPYKNERKSEIVPKNDMERQLLEVQKLGFAMKDTNLYLDVHPNDTCMINLYNRYAKQKMEALERYERQYGPITMNSSALNNVPWAWNSSKWPWEGGN